MISISDLHVFKSETAPATPFMGKFYTTTTDVKTKKVRPDWWPIVFMGSSEDSVRDQALRWLEEQQTKALNEATRIEKLRTGKLKETTA